MSKYSPFEEEIPMAEVDTSYHPQYVQTQNRNRSDSTTSFQVNDESSNAFPQRSFSDRVNNTKLDDSSTFVPAEMKRYHTIPIQPTQTSSSIDSNSTPFGSAFTQETPTISNSNHFPLHATNSNNTGTARLLQTVPEESNSDSSDDESLPDLKQIVSDLEASKLSEDLKKADSQTSDEDSPLTTTTRRRGFRHYARQEKNRKKKDGSIVTKLRKIVLSLIKFSLITRCFFYWLPLALILFLPLAMGVWVNPSAKLGEARIMWIFIWLEIVWGSLWVARLFASTVPYIFKFIASVVAPGLKKYRSVLQALEVPITLVCWALVSLCTFMPVMTQKANAERKDATSGWQKIISNILAALLISSLIYLCERLIIHLISVSFHKKRFASRIKDNKQSIRLLSDLLYCACIPFPPFCPEFAEEDLKLQSGTFLQSKRKTKFGERMAKSHNLQRIFGKVNHGFDIATSALGRVARGQIVENDELRNWVSSTIADSMGSEALADVLAKRIWMSLVLEDEEHLKVDDLIEVLGEERKKEAQDIFRVLDIDGNGDLSLDEMVSAVVEICHERKSVYKSLKDVDSAIGKLHSVLMFIVLIIIIIVFIGMLAPSVSAVLATLGTSILALSFVFSTTAQELLASCVFLFVKHPIDVGDRVEIATNSYVVKEISLLYTVFTEVLDGAVVQAPNSVLNTLWIENWSRAGPMTYMFTLVLGMPETSIDQINQFVELVNQFCLENSRDYLPDPFIYCTEMKDLDRFSLTCGITFRSNFSDGILYSIRRNKLIQYVGRVIYDLGITVPRREDNNTDPGLPLHIQSLGPEVFSNISGSTTDKQQQQRSDPQMFGKRTKQENSKTTVLTRPRAVMGFKPIQEEPELEAIAESEEYEEYSDDKAAGTGGVQIRRAPTAASAAVTFASSTGVSRSATLTGRRRRDT